MSEGWVKIHRKLQDNKVWLSEPFTRAQAWVDLILLANHKDGYIRVAGERIDLKRGQCGWSILNLSKRWKWSRGKTTRFLKELANDAQITLKTDTRNSIITICNYNDFQSNDTTDSTTDDTTDGHQMIQQTDTNKNVKKEKNEKNIDFLDKEIWKDFLAMRIKIKKPMTEKAKERMLSKLEKLKQQGHDVNALLVKSTDHCWQDVYVSEKKETKKIAVVGKAKEELFS